MSRIDEILDQMVYVTENIGKVVSTEKKQGKKVVGVLPVYTPEELIHAAGMFPIGCWGGTTTISKAAKYFPPFACTIMQAVMEFAEDGTYGGLDAFVVSTPCDTLKAVSQDLIYSCPDKKVIILTYPQNNKLEAAVRYTVKELTKVREKLEEVAGHKITDDDITRSIKIYNEHSTAMMDFCNITAANPGLVSAVNRHYVIKSGYFMLKEEHTALVKELNELLKKEPDTHWTGSKIILSGYVAEPNNLLSLFDEYKMAVVGDELAQESRQFRTPIPAGKDPIERLARQWQDREACSVIVDSERKRAAHIANMAAKQNADAVIYCLMKFCDPEEFDYPSIVKACKKVNVPVLNIDVDQLTDSTEQIRTRLQAFNEQIGGLNKEAIGI